MDYLTYLVTTLFTTSPVILALVVSLAGICLAAFALFVVHAAIRRRDRH